MIPSLVLAVTIAVDAGANRHPISPNIYGVSWADPTTLTHLGVTMNRWGGNAMSRYNWAFSTANRCKDYYFENIPDTVSSGDGSNGKSADDFIGATRAAGVQPLITIPLMGKLPKDRSIRCGYSVIKYGAQDSTDPYRPDCGNGKTGGVRKLHVNDPADTSATYGSAHQANWVQHLVDTWGSASEGGVRYYSLDNEASLWSFDHWDVHPAGSTYDEVWSKMQEYGAAIKAKDPGALLTGPDEWGWNGYFQSGLDQENYGTPNADADRNAHGGVAYIDWLLGQFRTHEENTGIRLLDVLAVHIYPQSGEFGSSTTQAMQLLRNRSTRALWDPNYVDESWIGGTGIDGGRVRLIPRLKEWVANHYPGTRIGITEYNWGAEQHINGATAQADILGIMGREGVDMAIRWTSPPNSSHVYNAIRMYRNYDGNQSRFGDVSVSATGPNPDNVAAFAAVRSSDAALTVMIVAKDLSGNAAATVNLANFVPYRSAVAQRWQLASSNTITRLADVSLSSSSLTLTLPPQTITLLVLPGAIAPGAPVIGNATPGNGSVIVSFTPPASDGGSSITSYTATCNPGAISGSGAASPVAVNGLTNGLVYACSVVAVNAAGTSAASEPVNVTPIAPGPAVTATATNTTTVSLSWPAVPGAGSYEIHRNVDNAGFSLLHTTSSTSHSDSNLTPNTTYLYKVRAVGSEFGAVDAATTIAFSDALGAGTFVRAAHVTELRTAATAMLKAAGLPLVSFTDPSLAAGTQIKRVHLIELRSAVDAARNAIGLPQLAHPDPTITTGVTTIKAAHLTTLRSGVH